MEHGRATAAPDVERDRATASEPPGSVSSGSPRPEDAQEVDPHPSWAPVTRAPSPRRQLTDEQVLDARRRWRAGASANALAGELGLSQPTIEAALMGRTYRNVPEIVTDAEKRARRQPSYALYSLGRRPFWSWG